MRSSRSVHLPTMNVSYLKCIKIIAKPRLALSWPQYMNLKYSAVGKILMNNQFLEMKQILRNMIMIIEARLIFEHSFPDLATHAIWKRKALLNAITNIMWMPNTVAQGTYAAFKGCVWEDINYENDLSKVVCYQRCNKVYTNKCLKD